MNHMKTASILPGFLILLFGGACSAPDTSGAGGPLFSFRVSIDDPATGCVRVTALFEGLEHTADPLRFSLPRGHTFLNLDAPLLEGEVTASAAGAALPVERLSPFTWEVDRHGAADVCLEYTVPLRHRGLAEVAASHHHYEFPYLDADHGMLTTWTLCLTPRDVEPATIRVAFALPDGWDLLTPWPAAPRRDVFEPVSLRALTGDLVGVGRWSRHTIRVGDFEGTVAFAPGQDALERAAAEPIRRIIENELALFGRSPAGRYLFLFGRPDAPGAGGSPKTNSMTLSINPELGPHTFSFLGHLVAHEFHHTWSSSLYNAPDEMRWFNEGFTDYYAFLVIARVGLSTWEEFAGALAKKMAECDGNSHGRTLSLVEAGGDIFFRDRDANRLVYAGGLLAAAWLDRAIRARGDGRTLDDFMRRLNNDPRWSRGRRAPGVDDFLETLSGFVDGNTLAAAERLVREPFSFDPVEAFSKTGVIVTRTEREPSKAARFDVAVDPWRRHALPD